MSITGTQDIAWSVAQVGSMSGSTDIRWSIDEFQATIRGSQLLQWGVGVDPTTQIQVVLDGAPTGRVGILTVAIVTFDGGITVYFPTTQGIDEVPAGSGRYVATVPLPAVGQYFVVWSDGPTVTQAPLRVLFDSVIQTPIRATSFADYRIKVGDTEPGLLVTLRNAGGSPIDLSSAEAVTTSVRRAGDTAPTVDQRTAVILDPADGGQVLLEWIDGDTDVAGTYAAEFGISWLGSGRSTAPSKATYRFVIEASGI